MIRQDRCCAWISAPLAVVLAALAVLVPILDRELTSRDPVLEASHDPATCIVLHDHTVCTQFGANRWAPSAAAGPRLPERPLRRLGIRVRGTPARPLTPSTVRARSPPAG